MSVRPAEVDDAAALAALLARNREHLAPYEPDRPEAWFTVEGQREQLRRDGRLAAEDRRYGWVVLDGEEIAGTIVLENVIRGPAQCANVAYWVDGARTGRGLATAALRAVVAEAAGPLGLHRLEGSTLVDNAASQRVLARNGFERIGIARAYLHIGGAWRDHVLFQRLLDARAPDTRPRAPGAGRAGAS